MNIIVNARELALGMRAVSLAMGGAQDTMLVDVSRKELRLVATDVCWIAEWSCGRFGADATRVALDGRSVRAMLPAVTGLAETDSDAAQIVIGDDVVRLEHPRGSVEMVTAELDEAKYANTYRKYTRPVTPPPPSAWWAASGMYMARVAEAFQIVAGGSHPNLLFRTGGERDPVYVTSEQVPSLRITLMPVNIDGRTDFKTSKR